MIRKEIRKVKRYCCEDISSIENYAAAVADKENVWECHHRLEDKGISRDELKTLGLYYKRPASELIFLTKEEHLKLHNKGNRNYFHKNLFVGKDNWKSRVVYQIDHITKKILKVWDCVRDAARFIGKHNQGILDCCYGIQKTCAGYEWCYPDDYEKRYGVTHTLF